MAAAAQFLGGREGAIRASVELDRPPRLDAPEPAAPQPVAAKVDANADPSAELTELLGMIARGDQAALESLYDLTLPRVFAVARRICVDSALAEGATEDVYFQIWREAARFDAGPKECLVVEGDLWLDGQRFGAGDYQFAPRGTAHHRIHTESGCVLFVRSPSPRAARLPESGG